ncbi:hypothetical protein WICPIJ_001566 [Wickerhamomyces pijperi]|uniref:2-(3-amino-3-carboxypropyl)histidine synthase subunit 1 n=1 Tax=Wickerhamomyces pijperi TaxID=599730 RepID=A0A9P8TR07_WICPI|nr:hypothetical protein WICPIJ_001566 [Wickerhamomyces pijperi]
MSEHKTETQTPEDSTPKQRVPRRRFVGSRKDQSSADPSSSTTSSLIPSSRPKRTIGRAALQIPPEILNDEALNQAIKLLPSNYNFEIHKTIWNIRKQNAKRVALQMPEGLLIYSLIISDIIQEFCEGVEVIVMGDVSYGACCIDDYTARSLECDFIVHYAHSCLVPIDITLIKVLYIFVTINIDEIHLINTIKRNFAEGSKIATFGTIQFNPTIHAIKQPLLDQAGILTIPPQISPLSKGEVLGCTSQRLDAGDIDAMIYVGDGRFHLESAMIHNPDIPAYRYDPYSRKFTREHYDQKQLGEVRRHAVDQARDGKVVGLVLGALGRQGSLATLENLETKLTKQGKTVIRIILSEIFPQKLSLFDNIDYFVQVACPRLSIDWGYAFHQPLLTPYEAMVMLGEDQMWEAEKGGVYPMDYYGKEGYGRGKVPDHKALFATES